MISGRCSLPSAKLQRAVLKSIVDYRKGSAAAINSCCAFSSISPL